MSLSVADALRDGLERTFERTGLQIVGVFVAVRFASVMATNTLNRANLTVAEELGALPDGFANSPFPGLAEAPTPFAIGLGLGGAYLLFVLVALLAEAARIVAVRTLVSERVDAIPLEYVRRNIGTATLNGFVGGLVVLTLAALGLIVFVVPGIFLALSFFFVRQEIAVRDVNFVAAMRESWELSRGHRFQLFALVLLLFVVSLIGMLPGAVIGALSPAAAALVGVVVQAVVVVFGIASVSRAYVQLREADEAEPTDSVDYSEALTADDLPPPDENRP